MNKDKQNLELIYNEVLIVMERLFKNDHDALAVAAILASQAMGLYKAVLSDDEYDRMIESIVERKDYILPFEARVLH